MRHMRLIIIKIKHMRLIFAIENVMNAQFLKNILLMRFYKINLLSEK